jgi:hypothetical protein
MSIVCFIKVNQWKKTIVKEKQTMVASFRTKTKREIQTTIVVVLNDDSV